MKIYESPLSNPQIIPNPYPVYKQLRKAEPIHWNDGLKAWSILNYDDCKAILCDPSLKAERMGSVLEAKFPNNGLPKDSIYYRFTSNVMMYTDGKAHDSLKKSTANGFTKSAHAHYSDLIKKVAFDLVNTIPQTDCEIDGVKDLALKMPVEAAVHAFGLPREDLQEVLPRVDAVMTFWSGSEPQAIELDNLLQNLDALHEYSLALVQGKRGKVLPDTVIARLAASATDNPHSTMPQTIHQLVLLLVALFAPTTPGSLSSGMKTFAENPHEVKKLKAKPDLIENLADEVVRYNASNQFTWRLSSKDFELNGQKIKSGDNLVIFLGSANRDSEVFENPDQFNLERPNSSKHISFGFGSHSCLGRHIASLEIKWFFDAFFKRFSTIDINGECEWNQNLEFRSLKSLPLKLKV